MMARIDRIRYAASTARTSRARPDSGNRASVVNLPIAVGPVIAVNPAMSAELPSGDSEFNAHLMGQDGQRRGLRAGPPLLDAARQAYNRVEWSGRWDRRARAGRQARTEI